jgi:ABC-type branched-subunit amino acid transport system substrate-binding protein
MRQHSRSRRVFALLLGLSLVAAACGGDDDDSAEEGEGGTTETTEVDPKIAAANEVGDADPQCEGETDGKFTIGELLPETGDLAFLDPPMRAGAGIALAEINDAGGVLGQPVEYLEGDSGDESPDLANPTVERHLQAGADMILGAAASGISLNVIDAITGACKIQFSPANTSPAFLDYDDDDLYFRTAPSDILQGRVNADRAIGDGLTSMAILYRQDSYGEGLRLYFKQPFEEQGGEVPVDRAYDPEAQDFSAEIDEVVSEDPDGLILIGFDESSRILSGLFEQGFTPDQKTIYLVDGNTGNALGEDFADQPGALEGVTGTYPSAELTDEFRGKMLEQNAELIDFLYGPETYDAVIITALAAEAAETDQPDEVARNINAVTRDGTECTGFVECRDLIAAGEDIDYTGPSGPQDFSQPGEPTKASFAVETFGADNQIDDAKREFIAAEL